jgi:hypothetical protein
VLRALAVRETCRRQKHGRALVEYIVRHAYEVGVGRMYAVSAMPWFVEAVGFELRKRTMLPEDARRLPGIIDAPSNAFVFELRPTQNGRRVPRRSVPRSAVEALLTRSERKAALKPSDLGLADERHQGAHVGPGRAEGDRGDEGRGGPRRRALGEAGRPTDFGGHFRGDFGGDGRDFRGRERPGLRQGRRLPR